MAVAIDCAGFTPAEADQLRRSMATFKFTGGVVHFRDKLVGGMIANGYEPEFAFHLPPAGGVRLLRLSDEPCRQLRAARLCLELDEASPSRGFPGGDPQ